MFFITHTDIAEGTAAIIEIDGPLNSESSPDFDDYISKLADNNIVYLLVDMKNLKFISSEGIGATLMIQKTVNEKNGLVIFFNMNYEIISLFRLLGFDKVFTIAEDRADALSMLDRRMELSPPETSLPAFEEKENNINEKNQENYFKEEGPVVSTADVSEPELFEVFEDTDDKDIPEESPGSFVIECIKCRSLIRVKESGEQLCPFCSAEFTVTDDKKAVFKIREIHS